MSSQENSFQNILLNEIVSISKPIVLAGSSDENCIFLLENLGWSVENINNTQLGQIKSALAALATSFEIVEDLLITPPSSIADTKALLIAFNQLFEDIRQLDALATSISFPELANLGNEIVSFSMWLYLHSRTPVFAQLLSLFGCISFPSEIQEQPAITDSNGVVLRNEIKLPTFNLGNIANVITDLNSFFVTEYGLPPSGNIQTSQDSRLVASKLFSRLSGFLRSLNLSAHSNYKEFANIDLGVAGHQIAKDSLTIYLHQGNNIHLSLVIMLSPADRGDLGLVVQVEVIPSLDEVWGNYRVKADFPLTSLGVGIGPHGITLPSGFPVPYLEASVSVEKITSPDNPAISIGSESESRLTIDGFEVLANGLFTAAEKFYGVSVNISRGKLILHPANGDNFLAKILPAEGLEAEFDFTVSWDNVAGLHFSGSGSLEVEIPVHKTILNTLTIDSARLSVKAGNAIDTFLAINSTLKIGPVTATIAEAGLKAAFTFPSTGGNLGVANVDFDFKAPTGAGLVIESPAVTGGGFLNFDEDTKTYTGAIELSFKKFSLNAFGIIQTQLPDGSDGYSLLIFITSQFQPIQIGMGFTLNGVGGMLGLNRSTNIDFLRAGIRDNTLSNILFPTDVVANISSIISTVDQAFPVQQGRFVFGPMAKIGWGTPTILTIDLGILIEVPDPVLLTIVGVAKAILPDQDKQTLKLQVNFLGVINFDQQYLSFDASIYDSSLLSFALSGDMALRLVWGSSPNFLLSVGGFHPSYTPSAQFSLPELRRIGVQIFNEDNLRVRFECYFALTSNSAQFGAKLDAYAAAGKYSASALLWFNVLFQFSPFHMLADMGVQVDIKRNSDVILAAFLHASVEGPGPWRVWGEVSFEFLRINFSIHFDKTFGQGSQQLNQSVAVWNKFIDALNANDNWSAAFPDRNSLPVILRDLQLPSGTLLAEPFGNLAFTQRVLPLNTVFSKYGNAPLNDFKKFSILNIRDGNNNPLSNAAARDFFASNEFYYLSDEQKLSKPAYELFDAGVTITGTGNIRSCYFVHREYNYENVVIDMRERADTNTGMPAVTAGEFEAALMGNTISQSPLAATFNTVPHNGPVSVSRNSNEFTLAYVNDLSLYGNTPVYFGSETEATLYRDALVAANPNLMNELIIIDQLELVA